MTTVTFKFFEETNCYFSNAFCLASKLEDLAEQKTQKNKHKEECKMHWLMYVEKQ